MAHEPSNAELLIHLDYIRKAADQTNAHLLNLNGRVGEAEDRVLVLETRADESKATAAKYGGMVGGVITAAGVIWQFFQGGK